jgi:predicted PurR-regulated permease PerM
MTASNDRAPDRVLSTATIDFAIRLGFIALLGYWSFRVIAPFLTIGLWSAILAVALYPVFDWLTRWLSPRAAAVLVTVLCLMIVVGPLTWLGSGVIGGVRLLVSEINTGHLAFPLPPEAVKGWPIVGSVCISYGNSPLSI